MRLHIILPTLALLTMVSLGQTSPEPVVWIVDDFTAPELSSSWTQSTGKWSVDAEQISTAGAGTSFALVNSMQLMRTKPYLIDLSVKGMGGAVFCMENPNRLSMAHVAFFTGTAISTGYFDFAGKYVETRVIDYLMPSTLVRMRISVNPIERTYSIKVQDRDVAREDLRFISGFSGLYAVKSGAAFDYFQLLGTEQADSPSFLLKSNNRQLDHLSYMTLMEDAVLFANPMVGMIQRVTSVGNFVMEIPVQGPNSEPRGIAVDHDRWIYIVDGKANAVRIYNAQAQLERVIGTGLTDPRGVAAGNGKVYVLDIEGIKVFNKDGSAVSEKARGTFKDAKNIFLWKNRLYVADFGNAQVQVLNASDFSVAHVIKQDLVNPWDVSVDESNNDVYVADPGASAVFRYDERGTMMERIEPVTIRGFISPRAVRVRENMIYVGDFERILGFKKGTLTIRPTLRIES